MWSSSVPKQMAIGGGVDAILLMNTGLWFSSCDRHRDPKLDNKPPVAPDSPSLEVPIHFCKMHKTLLYVLCNHGTKYTANLCHTSHVYIVYIKVHFTFQSVNKVYFSSPCFF